MKQRVLLAATATLSLAILCIPAYGQGGGTQSFKFPLSGVIYNPCCDELIEFSGNSHSTIKETPNGDGTISVSFHSNTSGVKGVGLTSGINYNMTDLGKVSGDGDPGSMFSDFSGRYRTKVVGKGKNGRDCSFTMTFTFHFAQDADGNIVTNISDVDIDCANGATVE